MKTQHEGTGVKVTLNSRQLRRLVADAVPITFEGICDEPFTEAGRDDGRLHAGIDSEFDSFDVSVDLRAFLSARFGARNIELSWSEYEWRYSATFAADLTPAQLQALEDFCDEC